MTTQLTDLATLSQDHWTDDEHRNAELAHRFIQLLMNDHDFDAVRAQFGQSSYIQHNRSIPDGIEGVIEYVQGLVKRFPGYAYDVKQIVASGDRVVLFSHATMRPNDRDDQSKGFVIFDMWRIEDGNLVEHWDSLQALALPMRMIMTATGGRIRNDNGSF